MPEARFAIARATADGNNGKIGKNALRRLQLSSFGRSLWGGKFGKPVHGLCLPYAGLQLFAEALEHEDGEAKSRCVEWPVGVGQRRLVEFG